MRALPERLHDTLELLSEAFFTLGHDFRFGYLNQAAEGLLGRAREELLGKRIWDEFPEAVGTESDREYTRALREGVTVRFVQHYPPLGKWFEAEAHPVPDGLAVYFRDITERQLHVEQLREQAALLDAANDAIILMDLDWRVQYWNAGARSIYGREARDVLGRLALEVLGGDVPQFREACRQVSATGSFTGELAQSHTSGQELITQCRWNAVYDDAGRVTKFLAIHSDITHNKKLESQFLRVQRMESIGALAGGIAHDLNNTLSPILLAVALLDTDGFSDEQLESLETIESCTRRGAAMVKQLLAFARGTGDQKTRTDLRAVATELSNIVRDTFPKSISFNVILAEGLLEVEADATQIHQVLTNLCVNARDAMPSGGRLSVTFETEILDESYTQANIEARPGPHVVVTIEDTGMGIPKEIMDRIFEPFFTTKELGKGTGLGLSTSHAIVRNHDGFIRVYSEVGQGTRFKVYLPALAEPGATHMELRQRSTHPRGNGEVILVVDDEAPIRQMAQRTLERYGYQVLLAENGAEAISVYVTKRQDIALVLTDMTMPIMDGPTTVVALRALCPTLKIIGASGLGANGNVTKALQFGMNNFVPKPYTAEALLQKIRQVLDEDGSLN